MQPTRNTFTFFTKYKVVVWVALIGLVIYFLISLCFLGIEGRFKLHSNTALSEYATAIAGIVGTTITILGLGFLIYAYEAQQAQAREQEAQMIKQQAQSQFDIFNKLYENLLTDINSIQYRKKYKTILFSPHDSELFQGVDALFNYAGDEDNFKSSVLNHLNLILISFKNITDFLEESSNKIEHKKLLLDKMYLLFLSKIFWPCDKISNHYRARLLKLNWGYPFTLFYHFDYMTNKAYRYLIDKNIIVFPSPDNSIDSILRKDYTIEGQVDVLGPTVRSVLLCKYDSIDTYWSAPPTITNHYGYPSTLRNIVLGLFDDSAYTDAIMEKFDAGSFVVARKGLVWVKNKILTTKPGRNSQNGNPLGCWEPTRDK